MAAVVDKIYNRLSGKNPHASILEKLETIETKLDLLCEMRDYVFDGENQDKKKNLRDAEKLIEKERKLARIDKMKKAEAEILL